MRFWEWGRIFPTGSRTGLISTDLRKEKTSRFARQIWRIKRGAAGTTPGEDYVTISPEIGENLGLIDKGGRPTKEQFPNIFLDTLSIPNRYHIDTLSIPIREEEEEREKDYLLTLDCAKGQRKGPGARAPGPVLPSIGLCPPYATLAPSQRRGKCWRLPTCTRTPPRDHGNAPPTWPFALPSCTDARRSEALRRAPESPRLPA